MSQGRFWRRRPGHFHRASGRREFHGVFQKVRHHAEEAVRIAHYEERPWRHVERQSHASLARQRPQPSGRALHHESQIRGRSSTRAAPASNRARAAQHLHDHLAQACGALPVEFQQATLLRAQGPGSSSRSSSVVSCMPASGAFSSWETWERTPLHSAQVAQASHHDVEILRHLRELVTAGCVQPLVEPSLGHGSRGRRQLRQGPLDLQTWRS